MLDRNQAAEDLQAFDLLPITWDDQLYEECPNCHGNGEVMMGSMFHPCITCFEVGVVPHSC